MFRYNIPEKFQILDGGTLKLIACISMLIDHAAVCLLQNMILIPSAPLWSLGTDNLYKLYLILRVVGRIAFPIYAFLLVEGFTHTKDRKKYALRLLIFAIISEIPFDLCIFNKMIYLRHNNAFFTLLLGLLALWTWEQFKNRLFIQLPVCALLICTARFFHTDYGWRGVLLIFILYMLRTWRIPQIAVGLIPMVRKLPSVLLGYIPLLFYNGNRGKQRKYFFYAFYPAHLLLLYLLYVFIVNRF